MHEYLLQFHTEYERRCDMYRKITAYYWESEHSAEIDFVIQRDGDIIPIEVKSADI